jgi:hypothetical protein
VRARTDRLQLAGEAGASTLYRVRAAAAAAGAHGTLEIVEPSGPASSRAVDAATCDEAVDALALIVALAIDPNASTAPHALLSAPAPTPAPAPEQPPPAARPVAMAPAPRATAQPTRWRFAATAGATFVTGAAPALLVGPAVSIEAAAEPPGTGVAAAPAVRLGFVRAASPTVSAGVGAARFTWTVGRLEGCPVRAALGAWEAMPCVRFDGGVLEATGADVDVPSAASRPWLAVGGVARVRWRPGAFFLEVDGGVSAALTRDHFYFDQPPTTIYDVPGAGAQGDVAAGARFW